MTTYWTDERVELLTRLWDDGWTASRIADRFGTVTRNAVIGKVHRLGLCGRAVSLRAPAKPSEAWRRQYPRKRRAAQTAAKGLPSSIAPTPAPAVILAPAPRPAPPSDIPTVSILELESHHCKWPCALQGNIDSLVYCGAACVPGKPYCDGHVERAYRPEMPPKGRAVLTAPDFGSAHKAELDGARVPAEADA